jgi:serine acetyltransferase
MMVPGRLKTAVGDSDCVVGERQGREGKGMAQGAGVTLGDPRSRAVWPSPALCRRSLALRCILPRMGTRVLGRLLRAAMNWSRRRAGLPPAAYAYCAKTVRLREHGVLTLQGGYLLEEYVELIMGTDGHATIPGSITLGHDVVLRSGTILSADGGCLEIGASTYVGFGCVLLGGSAGLRIGSQVMFGPGCLVAANNHGMVPGRPFQEQPPTSRGITIADNVWIGGHVTIVDGVSIGTGSVIAAGAVVTRDIGSSVLAAGVPACVVKTLG